MKMTNSILWMVVIFTTIIIPKIRSLVPLAPNILVYLVDDLGWMDTGIYGSKSYSTPNIDRLARSGLLFTDAYVPNPMCTPSRASLLTGKYPSRFHITQPEGHLPPQEIPPSGYASVGLPHLPYICPESVRYLNPSEWTVSKYLQSVGYRTGFIGKWHLGLPESTWPDKHGFDVTWHGHPDNGPPLPHGYFAPYSFNDRSITSITSDEYLVDRVTDEGIRFIQSNRKSPFFLLLSQFGVHAPWQAHLADIQRHSAEFLARNDSSSLDSQNNPIMASMIEDVDKSVGRIIDQLALLKLLNNTFIIFTSDNGGEIGIHSHLHRSLRKSQLDPTYKLPEWMKIYRQYAGEGPATNNYPLRGGKGSLYEGGLRIPLIISYPPLIKPNSTSSTPVSLIDIFPTIFHLVSEYVPSPIPSNKTTALSRVRMKFRFVDTHHYHHRYDGINLLPLLCDVKYKLNRTDLFGFYPHGPVSVAGVSLRSHNWKFIRRFVTGNDELYDLSKDLSERNDLSDSHPLLVKEFHRRLDQFIIQTRSRVPIPNPHYNKTLGNVKLSVATKGVAKN